jgi:hypothetical protein
VSGRLGIVVVASVLVSSPVVWMVQEGTLTPEDAVQRWAICLAACWLAITVVGSLAFPDPRPTARPRATEEPEEKTPVDAA